MVINVLGLAKAYTIARSKFHSEGRAAFRKKFPLFTNSMWDILDNIGNDMLLPQFFFYSDQFTNGILRLKDSLAKQKMLQGIVKNDRGRDCIEFIEVGKNGESRPVLKELATLDPRRCEALLYGLSMAREAAEVMALAHKYRLEILEMSRPMERWERKGTNICINRKCKINKSEWFEIAKTMGWLPRSGGVEWRR